MYKEVKDHSPSTNWLRENYRHIWNHRGLKLEEKAGFLAAVCHPHRCSLAILDLVERVQIIRDALFMDGQ